MEMVLKNRRIKESDDTDSTPAATSFSKINLKIVLCLFLLAVMANNRFLSTSESFSSPLNNIQIEVKETNQEAEHVVKVRKGFIIRNIIPMMSGDGVVHF